jgi:hypothetical protein
MARSHESKRKKSTLCGGILGLDRISLGLFGMQGGRLKRPDQSWPELSRNQSWQRYWQLLLTRKSDPTTTCEARKAIDRPSRQSQVTPDQTNPRDDQMSTFLEYCKQTYQAYYKHQDIKIIVVYRK